MMKVLTMSTSTTLYLDTASAQNTPVSRMILTTVLVSPLYRQQYNRTNNSELDGWTRDDGDGLRPRCVLAAASIWCIYEIMTACSTCSTTAVKCECFVRIYRSEASYSTINMWYILLFYSVDYFMGYILCTLCLYDAEGEWKSWLLWLEHTGWGSTML